MDELTMSQFASKEDLLEAKLEHAEKEIELLKANVAMLSSALEVCATLSEVGLIKRTAENALNYVSKHSEAVE